MSSKKIFIFIFCFTMLSIELNGQWNELTQPSSKEINDVEYVTLNKILFSGSGGITRTSNGGDTWTNAEMINSMGDEWIWSLPLELKYYDDTTLFMAGMMFGNNSAMVMKSIDDGNTWIDKYTNSYGQWPRTINNYYWLDNTFYACGNNGLLLKSFDKGETWIDINTTENFDFKNIIVVDQDILLSVFDKNVGRSIDGGKSWSVVLNRENELFLDIKKVTPLFYVAISNSHVFITKDGGNTWQSKLSYNEDIDTEIYGLKNIDIAPNGDIYILAFGYVFRSEDDCESWGVENLPIQVHYNGIDFYDDNNAIVIGMGYQESNLGVHTYITSNGPDTKPFIKIKRNRNALCVDSIYDFTFEGGYLNSYEWYANDSLVGTGKTLQFKPLKGSQDVIIKLIGKSDTYTISDTCEVKIEDDLNHNIEYDFFEGTQCPRIFGSIEITNPISEITYSLGQEGLKSYKDKTVGNTYSTKLETGELKPNQLIFIDALISNSCGTKLNRKYIDLHFVDTLQKIHWKMSESEYETPHREIDIVSPKAIYSSNVSGEIVKSTDYGRTFEKVYQFYLSNQNIYAIDFFNEKFGIVVTGGDVYETRDSAKTFNEINHNGLFFNIQGVKIENESLIFCWGKTYFGDNSIITKSSDGGKTWENVYLNEKTRRLENMINVKLVSGDTCFANVVNSKYITPDSNSYSLETLISYDLGETWFTDSIFRTGRLSQVHYFSTKSWMGVIDDEFYKTNDAGETWTKSNLKYKGENWDINSFQMIDKNIGYAIANYHISLFSGKRYDYDKGLVYKTINGGECWQLVTILPYELIDIKFSGDTLGIITGRKESFKDGVFWRINDGQFPIISKINKHACIGDTIDLINLSSGFDSYDWYLNDELLSQEENSDYIVPSDGEFKFKLIGHKNSKSETSNLMHVVADTLSTSVITSPLEAPSICLDWGSNFGFEAEGVNLSFQWQIDIGNGYVDTTGSANNLPNEHFGFANNEFEYENYPIRCIISGTCAADIVAGPINVNVVDSLRFFDMILEDTVCIGETANLIAEVDGEDFKYRWQEHRWGSFYYDLEANETFPDVTSKTLRILNVQNDLDGKMFAIEATNACGSFDGPPMTIRIGNQARVIKGPSAFKGCSHDSAYFSIIAEGYNKELSWEIDTGSGFYELKNNELFNGVYSDSLTISNISSLNNAKVRCKVSAPCTGFVYSNNLASINHSSDYELDSVKTTFCHPGLMSAQVIYSGGNSPIYEWEIDTGDGYNILPNGYLPEKQIFQSKQSMDNGLLKVSVEDCGKINVIQDIDIKLSENPVITKDYSTNIINFCAGDSLILEIETSTEDVNFQWMKKRYYNYEEVQNSSNFTGANTSRLIMKNGVKSNFYLKLSKDGCVNQSRNLATNINYGPYFTSWDDFYVCSEEKLVDINVNSNGYADSIFWFTNGDGFFFNEHKEEATYVFREDDLKKDSLVLYVRGTPLNSYCSDRIDSVIVYRDICTAISDISENTDNIYPNPLNRNDLIIELSTPNKNLKIYNTLGELIFEKKNLSNYLVLPNNLFYSGIYFIEIENVDGTTNVRRIVK